MIGKWYYWIWHDFLRLSRPISYSVVESISKNQIVWIVAGSLVFIILWSLTVHFIALEVNNYK